MLYTFAFAGYLTAVTLDLASGVHARRVGAQEQVLPQSPTTQAVVSGAIAGAEWAATHYLWTHHHRALAVGILVGSGVGHGWAASHNFGLRKVDMR